MAKRQTVAKRREYRVESVADARAITLGWLGRVELGQAVGLGLPEVDDRYHFWRIPLKDRKSRVRIGEVVVDAYTTEILLERSTSLEILEARLLGRRSEPKKSDSTPTPRISPLRNTIGLGDCSLLMDNMPASSVDLVFTSPPYFNARPEYSEYEEYDLYLHKMRQVIKRAHRVLAEGRFFVMNSAPVLVRRASRSEASRRIAVPFDLHRIFIEEGFEFIDDIIWVKPEGAGWATGRGRRFAADRNPMQYKAVPVTEYVMAYRKATDKLIDWHIRSHPVETAVRDSKIEDGYERTNIWRIHPATDRRHPAAFPLELAEKVIKYYSFKGDIILDPFAGSGTVGKAASQLKRRFVLFDVNEKYVDIMRSDAREWLGKGADDVLWLNVEPPSTSDLLL